MVDDGSTDGSGIICDRAAESDKRIRVLHRSNGGLSAARNTGLDAARGQCITFLDGDDLLDAGFCQILMEIIRDSGCGIACARELMFEGQAPQSPPTTGEYHTATGLELYETMLYQTGAVTPSACAKIYDRRLWEGVRFTEGTWYEDLEVSPRIFPKTAKIAWTADRLYHYRQHGGSFLHRFTPRRLDVLDVTEKVEKAVAPYGASLAAAAADRSLSAALNMAGLMAATRHRWPEAEARCRQTVRRTRRGTLLNPRARARNRAGALITYLGGMALYRLAARWVYRQAKDT